MFRTPIDLKYCTVEIIDGGTSVGSTNALTIRVGNGELTWTEHRNIEYIKDRGNLDTVRRGDQEPCDVRLTCSYILIMQDSANAANEPVSVVDALKHRGTGTNWVTTAADPCEPFAVDLRVTYDPICPGIKNEIVLFPDFRYETIEFNPKAGTLSITGKINAVEPVVTRVTDPTAETTQTL